MMHCLPLTPFRISLLVTAVLLALYQITIETSPMRSLEAKLLDLRLQLRGPQRPDVPVALVVIDD